MMLSREDFSTAAVGAAGIAAAFEARIRDGRLEPGDRLPPVRVLARSLSVSATTVSSAYQQLRRRGQVIGDGRRGTMVTTAADAGHRPALIVPAGVRNLADSNPDPAMLPDLTMVVHRAAVHMRLYGDEADLPELVDFAQNWLRADGVGASDVAIVSGGMDGIERVLRARLRIGDVVAVEDPGYAVLREMLHTLGMRPRPVPVDDEGMLPDRLAMVLRGGAAAVVSTPRAQNPFGSCMSAQRARDLRVHLDRHPGVLLIEDDHAAGLAPGPIASLSLGHAGPWAVVRSPAKFIGPDVRIAFLAGDATTLNRVRGSFLLGPGWVSNLVQQVALDTLVHAGAIRLARRATDRYTERRQQLLQRLEALGIAAYGRSGLNVWVPVSDEALVVSSLLGKGWAVAAGQRFRTHSDPAVRITTTTLSAEDADTVAILVSQAVRSSSATREA